MRRVAALLLLSVASCKSCTGGADPPPTPPDFALQIDFVQGIGEVTSLPDLDSAIKVTAPKMGDTQAGTADGPLGPTDTGRILLIEWAKRHLAWSDVASADSAFDVNQALLRKDSGRGDRICVAGTLLKRADVVTYQQLRIQTASKRIVDVDAVGASGEGRLRACGIITGALRFDDKTLDGVTIVGMLDPAALPPSPSAAPSSSAK